MDIVDSRCTNKDVPKHERPRRDSVNLAAILNRSLWFYQLDAREQNGKEISTIYCITSKKLTSSLYSLRYSRGPGCGETNCI